MLLSNECVIMHTGSILIIFFIILINPYFTFSSPTINVLQIQIKENDPSCIKDVKTNASTINYDSAFDNIPKTDETQVNDDWIFYVFDGLVAITIGIALSFSIKDLLFIFFEDEIRIHGIAKGICMTILDEIILANEFAYKEAEKQLLKLNNNNDLMKKYKPHRATAYVTRATQ